MTYVSPKLRPAMIDALIAERDGLRAELDALRIELNCAELAAEAEAEESDRLHDELKRMKHTDPIKDEREAFREWFESEQGVAYDGMWSFAKAAWMARAALGASSVPDGYKLVPIEPTIVMKQAGGRVGIGDNDTGPYVLAWSELEAIYAAMLAAAPEAKP